jgi:hypothetical protein
VTYTRRLYRDRCGPVWSIPEARHPEVTKVDLSDEALDAPVRAKSWARSSRRAGAPAPDQGAATLQARGRGAAPRGPRQASVRSPAGAVELVEPGGIEPPTSCLQSRRSPS